MNLKKIMFFSIAAVMIALVVWISFVNYKVISDSPYSKPYSPKGRVIYLPFGDEFYDGTGYAEWSILLGPMNGSENIFDWYVLDPGSVDEMINEFTHNQQVYDSRLVYEMFNMTQDEYYTLLSEGHVNFISINNRHQDYVDYFNSSRFKLVSSSEKFTIYELNPRSSYVSVNGVDVDASVIKATDGIYANFTCDLGDMITVKESYNENWVAYLDGKKFTTTESEYGFNNIKNTWATGKCNMKMVFEDKAIYTIAIIVSMVSWIFVIAFLVRDLIKEKENGQEKNHV